VPARPRGRHTGSVGDRWVHIGRLWTNGEPFLAVDAAIRGAWQGSSNDDYDQVVTLSLEDTSIPVGTGRALLVGADGVVRDDSWMEVLESEAGLVAIVQAAGPDYPGALAGACPGPVPAVHGPPTREADPSLLIPAPRAGYKLTLRWHTRLGEDSCFARWLLTPVQATS
jgi:hypothetical protein